MALSNLEIYWLVRELDELVSGGWFQKFWDITNGWKMRIRKDRPIDIILNPPEFIYATNYQFQGKEPSPLTMKIRKELDRSRLERVSQPNFDRLVEFEFSNGKRLIAEMFSKGNLVLVDSNWKTIVASRYERWRDREILPGREYKYPQSTGLDPREMNYEEFVGIFKEKDIIRSLVKGIKLGNRYLELACLLAGEDKTAKKPEDPKRLYRTIKAFLENYEPGIANSPVVAKLEEDFKAMPSFNRALDEFYSRKITVSSKSSKKLEKLRHRLEEQEKALERLKRDSEKYKQIGDAIYQNHQVLENLLKRIKEMKKTGRTWREIEKELGVKIKEKEGKVIVNLEA